MRREKRRLSFSANREKIGELIRKALPQEQAAEHSGTPEVKNTYMPAGHAKALHPNRSLVVGIRGAGKSFWWSVLQREQHRQMLGRLLPDSGIDRDTHISVGFGSEHKPQHYPSLKVLGQLLERGFDPLDIWRAVIFFHLMKEYPVKEYPDSPEASGALWREAEAAPDWQGRASWVADHLGEFDQRLYTVDQRLQAGNRYHLILFDALDRSADNWYDMNRLTRGLLQNLLYFRSLRRIRLKAFVRPDQLDRPEVTNFPDASKITGSKIELSWPRHELYGLLWQYLANEDEHGALFREECGKRFGVEWEQAQEGGDQEEDRVWIVPEQMRHGEDIQREVFHAISGPWMGRGPKRGAPYTWLPNHLGDSHRQLSPRSFLRAIHKAAEFSSSMQSEQSDYPLHFRGIMAGVQEASKIRVKEVEEDYPWVDYFIQPLEGLSVPCHFETIRERWEAKFGPASAAAKALLKRFSESRGAATEGRPPSADLSSDSPDPVIPLPPRLVEEGYEGLRRDLEDLGAFGRLGDGRVNMPDIYRVAYRIGRLGGVKAVR